MQNVSPEEWQRLSTLLDEVMELAAADRRAWLHSLASRDPEAAQQVGQLLEAADGPGFDRFLAERPESLADDLKAATLVGVRVGPYVIESEIGRGGMGSVWRARRADGRFEGLAAIKFLHLAAMGREGELRFRTEGSVLSRLDHTNIARLLDAGVLDGKQPYLVLEYVEGEALDVHCDRLSLNLTDRLRLFIDVLNAVAHAHNQLVVHRDIKPSNIFVTPDGVVKLIDFGIAKLLDDGAAAGLTQSGLAALTPLYAAPEQMLGQSVSAATDIYSLGVVLYELLTGSHPVSTRTQSRAEIAHAVITENPQPASMSAHLAAVRPTSLEGDIDNIIFKAMKKDPRERYESVSAFADDIRRFFDHEPVHARPDTLRYRTGKFVRRNRGSVLAASLTVLSLLFATAFSAWQMRDARQQRDQARTEARRADAVGEFLMLMIGHAGKANLDEALALMERQKVDDPLVKVNILRYLSGQYTEYGDPRKAVTILEEALALMRPDEDPIDAAQLDCSIANLDDDLGREQDADRHIRKAVAALESAGDSVRAQVRADCRIVESYIATDRGENRRAVATAAKAVAELEQSDIRVGLQHVTAVNALARAQAAAGNNRSAVQLLHEIRRDDVAQGRDRTVGGWIHGLNETRDLFAGGRNAEALALSGYIKQQSGAFGADADDVRAIDLARAQILLSMDRAAEAEPLLAPANAPMRKADADSLAQALTHVELKLQQGDRRMAALEFDTLADDIAAAIAAHKPTGAAAERVQARVLMEFGKFDEAEAALARAETLARDADGLPTPELRRIEVQRARNDLQRRDAKSACVHAQQAAGLARAQAVDVNSSAWIGEAEVLQSGCHRALGDTAMAQDAARSAWRHLRDNLGDHHPLTLEAKAIAGI